MDLALIRYYFGDRSSLLMAVVGELMKNIGNPRRTCLWMPKLLCTGVSTAP